MTDTAPQQRRQEATRLAATVANGPVELIDFLLPLWAGVALGAGPTQIGVLVAVQMAVSVLVRPVAGVLADRVERRGVAAVGAVGLAVSCAGYALATALPVAYAAAVLGGIGGALLWVSIRAIAAEDLARDSAVFARLMSARETGSWVAFVVGLTLLSVIDFRGAFLGCAAACLAAAAVLAITPRRPRQHGAGPHRGFGPLGRRLRPMLAAVAVTMAAEAAIGLLLLLHLQRRFDLEIVQIAYVFLPGAIAMAVLPGYLHRLVRRFGRARMLAVASIASAAFATGLAVAPNPVVIAALWILSGAAWAIVMPVQEATIAEASLHQVGRGMSLYEGAGLIGAAAGSLAAGVGYDSVSFTAACLVAAAVILTGAVLVPLALRAVDVPDVPTDTPLRPR